MLVLGNYNSSSCLQRISNEPMPTDPNSTNPPFTREAASAHGGGAICEVTAKSRLLYELHRKVLLNPDPFRGFGEE